jgi:arylformamidase
MNNRATIDDWDDAYANRDHIEDAEMFIDNWQTLASDFRKIWTERSPGAEIDVAYGSSERQRFDIFYPTGIPQGLFVFVHGGYWMALDKNSWSHLASQALDRGWAVAMPSYSLCPDVRISEIPIQIGDAIGKLAGIRQQRR